MPKADTGIDWGASLTLSFRLREVDGDTWEPCDDVPGAFSASIDKDVGGDLLESGSVNVEAPLSFEPHEMWGVVELLAEQGGSVERWPIATLLLTPGETEVRRGRKIVPYDGYGVLKAAQDIVLPTGYSVRSGSDGAAVAAEILSEALPSQVVAEGSFSLSDGIVLSRGTSRLEAAWMLVDAAGWCMQVDGRGNVAVRPKPTEPSLVLDSNTANMLGTDIRTGSSAIGLPNTYIAVDGSLVARAEIGNGRPVEVYDDAPKRVNGESLQDYAERMLASLNSVVGTRSYRRAWMPGLTVFDIVDGKLSEAGLDARMRIRSQRLTVDGELMVEEEVDVLP